MTQLVSLPSRPSPTRILTSAIEWTSSLSFTASDVVYGDRVRLFGFNYNTELNLTNAGTLWADNEYLATIDNIGEVVNSGLIVSYGTTVQARALMFNSSQQSFDNSGIILAYATTQRAWSIINYASIAYNNSGTIAAHSDEAVATALNRQNGGIVNNAATGRILAEGNGAIALYQGRGVFDLPGRELPVDIANAGEIRAVSTGGTASVAIQVVELSHLQNSGLVAGDYAFVGGRVDRAFVENLAGGRMLGAVDLGRGADRISNFGSIVGDVFAGEGNDLVDTRAGSLTGAIVLDRGNDRFEGSAGADGVSGGRENDSLSGNAGADLLLGGRGDDLLVGGAGNDGLYGEFGNDVLETLGGDVVDAGAGNDRVVAADLAFARIDGGAGFDMLSLPGDRTLDLAAALTGGRLAGIERLLLGGGGVAVRAGDAAALAGGSLQIAGSGRVTLVGAWSAAGTVVIDGEGWRRFQLGAEVVLVAGSTEAVIADAAPAGAGLDGIASGQAAALPGGPLLALTESVSRGSVAVDGNLVIEADEQWVSSLGAMQFSVDGSGVTLTNQGALHSTGTTLARSVVLGNFAGLVNRGSIITESNGGSAPISTISFPMSNGEINIRFRNFADAGSVVSGSTARVINSGSIRATTGTGVAAGVQTYGLTLDNSGVIEAVSNQYIAAGVYAVNGGTMQNSGSILASGLRSIGLGVSSHALVLDNSGIIRATGAAAAAGGASVALSFNWFSGTSIIRNSGTIEGEWSIHSSDTVNRGNIVLLNDGVVRGTIATTDNGNWAIEGSDDIIVNNGLIEGRIILGTGNDVYRGTLGRHSDYVGGDAGNDRLFGSDDSETIAGGAGDDVLLGGGSSDQLSGGDGRDRYVYTRWSDSTLAAPDWLRDFIPDFDMIDLTALGPLTVTTSYEPNEGVTTINIAGSGREMRIFVMGPVRTSNFLTATGTRLDGSEGDDILFAGHAGKQLFGGAGADTLVGGDGADWLDGGSGVSDFEGGRGDDTFVSASASDVLFEQRDGGTDMVISSAGFTLPDWIENLMLTGGASYGTGNPLNNVIIGNAGGNVLDGRGGNDTLAGGDGNDFYIVDSSADIIIEAADGGSDEVDSGISFYLYAGLETLKLNGSASFGVGNALDNQITGTDRDNLLLGGSGDDSVYASNGIDQLFGEDGNDRLFGEGGIDYLVGGTGNDTLDGDVDADALYGGEGDDLLLAQSPLFFDPIGGGYRQRNERDFVTDILVGGDGNDTLNGASGLGDYDLLNGGGGNDLYFVDTPADLTFEAAGEGSDTVIADIRGAGYYLYPHVENLSLAGHTPFGVGNDLANLIVGSGNANWLLGGAGDDTLVGGGGGDVLFGEAGADVFLLRRGLAVAPDVIGDFTPGVDRLDLVGLGVADMAGLGAQLVENNGTTAINFGGGYFVVLNGVARAELSAGDFIFG